VLLAGIARAQRERLLLKAVAYELARLGNHHRVCCYLIHFCIPVDANALVFIYFFV
jgi:hypothetical protein